MTRLFLNWSYDDGMWREATMIEDGPITYEWTIEAEVPAELWERYNQLEQEMRALGDQITELCKQGKEVGGKATYRRFVHPVELDIVCMHCGYYLGAMAEGQACPRCGTVRSAS